MFKAIRSQTFCKFTKIPEFTSKYESFKTFRTIDFEGQPISDLHSKTDKKLLNKILDRMIMLDETDRILYMAQR